MPTRQSTPGPSTFTASSDVLQPHNAKKRGVSEIPPDDELRQPKKHRKELELTHADDKLITNGSVPKDSKKKRRKKKRKSPLTNTEPEVERLTQSYPSTAKPPPPISAESSTTLSEASISSQTNRIASSNTLYPTIPGVSLDSLADGDEKPSVRSIDKGKEKALSEYPDQLIPQQDGPASVAEPSDGADSLKVAQAKIAELTAQLQSQKTLLSRHDDNLSHLQQSLTCEICLDLLYKPFSLSPCGHIACYMCLIRWFTSSQNNGNGHGYVEPPAAPEDIPALLNSQPAVRGVFLRSRKTCPLCRASVTERPAEIWAIKSMVANLVKSKLIDLPSSPPPSATETPDANSGVERRNDHWRNVFRGIKRGNNHHQNPPRFYSPPPGNNEGGEEGWGLDDMGMYDQEDGGIYRCLDCMHEIWGGVCTNCQREYPGHARFDDDDDDDFDDGDEDGMGENFLGRRLRQIWQGYDDHIMGGWGWGVEDDEDEDSDGDDDDDDDDDDNVAEAEFFDAHGDPMELTDESDSESSDSGGAHSDHSDGEWTTEDEAANNNRHQDIREPTIADVARPLWPPARRIYLQADTGHLIIEEEEDDDDDDNEQYHSQSDSAPSNAGSEMDRQDSFIDDGETSEYGDHREYPQFGNYVPHHHHVGDDDEPSDIEVMYDSNEEDEDEGGDEDGLDHRTIARQLGRGLRLGNGRTLDPNPPPLPPPPIARRNNRIRQRSGSRRESPIVVEDAEVNQDDRGVGPSRARRGGQRRVAGDIHDDEEDAGEEEGVRPAGGRNHRTRGGRRARPVSYGDSDVD